MSLALLFQVLSVFMENFEEIKALVLKILAEFDKEQVEGETSGLSVIDGEVTFTHSFLLDFRNDHGVAISALETCYDHHGLPMPMGKFKGHGSLLNIIALIRNNKDLILKFIDLVEVVQSGQMSLMELILNLIITFEASKPEETETRPAVE